MEGVLVHELFSVCEGGTVLELDDDEGATFSIGEGAGPDDLPAIVQAANESSVYGTKINHLFVVRAVRIGNCKIGHENLV